MSLLPQSINPGMRYAALRTLIAFATGIALSGISGLPWWTALIAIGVALILVHHSRGLSLYLIVAGLAFLYTLVSKPPGPDPNVYQAKRFQGIVIQEPLSGNRLTVSLLPPLFGKVRIFLKDSAPDLRYGDLISVQSKIKPFSFPRNPGLPDYNQILLSRGFVGTTSVKSGAIRLIRRNRGNILITRVVMPARRYLYRTIKTLLPPVESALLLGILLGDKTGLPPEVLNAFTEAGVLHLMAVSGLHVSIIIFAFSILLAIFRIRGWWYFILLTLASLFYILLVGWHPSAVRAGIMSWAVLLSMPIQRRANHIASLCIAALIILLLDPKTLFQTGFRLSFAATAAIITIVPKINPYLKGIKVPGFVRKLVLLPAAVSLAVTIGTAPVLLYHFYRFQPATVIANLLVVPLTTTALPLGIITAIANLFSPQLANIFAQTLNLNLKILLFIVDNFSKLSLLMVEPGKIPVFALFYFYLLTLLALNLKNQKVKTAFRLSAIIGLVILVWVNALKRPQTKVTFFDPGRGDAILLEDTLGRKLLIDAGIDGAGVLAEYLRARGIRYIDATIITHPDRDHYGGMYDLSERVKIGQIIVPTLMGDTGYQKLLDRMELAGTKVTVAGAGWELKGFGYTVQFVRPDPTTKWFYDRRLLPTNPVSLVTLVRYGKFKMLFSGDCEYPEITSFSQRPVKINLLKSPHHGSKKGNPVELLDILQPDYVIVMGRFPTPAGLETILPQKGINYINTRRDGGTVLSLHSRRDGVWPVFTKN